VPELPRAAGLAYREEGSGPPALLVHGYPNSSYLWRDVLPAIAAAGWRAIAPDLPGYGDSPADPPGTWERHVEALERFRSELGLDRVALIVHDWGGLIGLRWACEHQDAIRALVISDTGFFPDGKWHGLADIMRAEGQGEELMANINRDVFATMLQTSSPGLADEAVDEYWKAFDGEDRRRAHLELYRSGDFGKLAEYDGCLAGLAVPTLVIWGAKDEFAPVASAERFHAEIPGSRLVVLEEGGHFLPEDDPGRFGRETAALLATVPA
jgi:haloalkane dehalogenase